MSNKALVIHTDVPTLGRDPVAPNMFESVHTAIVPAAAMAVYLFAGGVKRYVHVLTSQLQTLRTHVQAQEDFPCDCALCRREDARLGSSGLQRAPLMAVRRASHRKRMALATHIEILGPSRTVINLSKAGVLDCEDSPNLCFVTEAPLLVYQSKEDRYVPYLGRYVQTLKALTCSGEVPIFGFSGETFGEDATLLSLQ